MDSIEKKARDRSRRGFLAAGVAAAAGFAGWRWLVTRPEDNSVQWPLRRILELNEGVAKSYFGPDRLAPTFAPSQAQMPRANGQLGMDDDLDPDTWKLELTGATGGSRLHLGDIQSLPRVEMTTELKCIEGWSTIVHWTGTKLSDFAQKYGGKRTEYVGLETPDGEYYVGLERASAFHPQTLLCYAMNGQPLEEEHGAPLRLVVPVKYGIKNLKRIGKISFTDDRPKDYWAEQGYDWYAGF